MTEEKRQHLGFIQTIITRMNTNSFQLKGLTVTLGTALMGIYASKQIVFFIFLGIPPTIIFWFLDSYYLQQERKFRGMYNDAANLNSANTIAEYEMPLDKYVGNGYSFFESFFSKTILFLYLTIVILLTTIGTIVILTK